MSDLEAQSREAIQKGSKSFAAAAALFDAQTRADAEMLYAWCRHCDDVIDGQTLGHGMSPVADGPARLEALGVAAGLRRDAVHAQAVAALDVVVHLSRERSGHRRVGSVDLLSRSPAGELVTVPGLMLESNGSFRRGPGAPALDALVAEVDGDG